MEQNFDKSFKKVEILFRCAGIYIRTGVPKSSDHFKRRCLYILHFVVANIGLFTTVSWCINTVINGEDLLGIMYNAPCITISALAQLKGFFLIKNEKHACKLVDNLKKLEAKGKQSTSSEKDKIVEKETKFLNFVLTVLNIFYAVVVGGFSLSPLLLVALKYYQTKKIVLTLPFSCLYGFDPLQPKVWPFVFLIQCWAEYVVCLDICSADYFFFICCTYIRIQFCLLQHDIGNIIPIEEESNRNLMKDERITDNLKELIEWHQELIKSTDILEVIYSKSTLLNFLSSSIIICLTGFNVTTVTDVHNIVNFLSFLVMSLFQVFFLCFFADLLMTSSTNISDAVYKCDWNKLEIKTRKKLLIILVRSQKPCKVTAFGFADVNLNSFMRVLSTAWSYFTLLQTMYGGET